MKTYDANGIFAGDMLIAKGGRLDLFFDPAMIIDKGAIYRALLVTIKQVEDL